MANRRSLSTQPRDRKKLLNLQQKIEDLYQSRDEEFDAELEVVYNNPPEKPTFPVLMITFAFIKDFLDVLDLLLIGMIFTTLLSFVLAVVLFIWVTTKGGDWWKRKLIRWIWVRYIAVIFLEFIPFVKLVPATTLLILMVHNKENKLVQLANESMEMIQSFSIKLK